MILFLIFIIGVLLITSVSFFYLYLQSSSQLKDTSNQLNLELGRNKVLEEQREKETKNQEKYEEHMKNAFENLSQKIFTEKTSQFKKDSNEQMNHLLSPFKEKLSEFQKKVDDYYKTGSNERTSLRDEIKRLTQTGSKMQEETQKLSQAIQGDIQYQGNWGELVLERILEKSGLREKQEFFVQGQGVGLKSDSGGILKPDFMIKLPKDRWLIIDSKVSLTHYLQYCDENLTEEKQKTYKKFYSIS